MQVQIEASDLEGVRILRPYTHEDHRGQYVMLYNKQQFQQHDINLNFVEDDISISHRNVIRGVHGDKRTWKLISCLHGRFYLIVANNNPESNQYRQWRSFMLSDRNRMQVLVPPLFGNGHLVLSETAIFHYKQSAYYNPDHQFTIRWNDPDFNFWWPTKEPILSRRDEEGDTTLINANQAIQTSS
ncbi:dTDP-4-dehydrorhamnose 3,5-epimerase family protein [Magnetococcales bacterium HHB-1]